VSHEPWMSHEICNTPEGIIVPEESKEQYNIFNLTYAEIKQFDCGSRGNEKFSEQQPMSAYKPSLLEAVTQVELHCKKNNLTPPQYNIEIKSQPDYDNKYTPEPATFARILLEDLELLEITNRTTVQSFDPRSLEEVHRQDSTVQTAYLVYQPGVERQMNLLSYTPEIYSPYYLLLNPATMDSVKKLDMKIIPWTINDVETMQRLIAAGVDGIITDYPNLIEQVVPVD
ncbi:MAG: glycerophosphodiester phosphodiesterase family protein, partial [Saprospiraceae bacterium]